MSIPIECCDCFDTIGMSRSSIEAKIKSNVFHCPGKGKHAKPVRSSSKGFFGLLNYITQVYPETRTVSAWAEYIGPKRKILLWFAVFFGTKEKRVIVKHKWVFGHRKYGLHGDGLKELASN